MTKLVTIIGGSGFLGRYIARRMAKEGWRVRVAVRNPNEALFVKPFGVVGQVEPVFCNIRDDASVAASLDGADAVVTSVGSFDLIGRNNCKAVQENGAARVARLAAEAGVDQLVHVSAIGADAGSDCEYLRSKGAGDKAVAEAFPGAVILRPSVLFGMEDGFFNRFAGMSRFSLVLPIAGAETLFQPVYVDDVAQAAVAGVTGKAKPGIYELGGPDVKTFRALIKTMLDHVNRRRLVINLPNWIARIVAMVGGAAEFLTFGIIKQPISGDQIKALEVDSVVSEGAKGFSDLGIAPTSMEVVLPDYLWRFRPSGQFDAIKASAKNLRKT